MHSRDATDLDAVVKEMLADVRIHGRERVVKQVDVGVGVDRAREGDSVLLRRGNENH